MDLNFKYFDAWLFHCQVCHFNVKSMEMDALNTLIDSFSQLRLADLANSNLIRHCAILVEFSEQVIEINISTRPIDEAAPVGPLGN
jgi:hypothetical protein